MSREFCTSQELRGAVRADLADWDDERVVDLIRAASDAVCDYARRDFGSGTETRRFAVGLDGWIDVGDLAAITEVIVDPAGAATSVVVADIAVIPAGRNPTVTPIQEIRVPSTTAGVVVDVTGVYGFPALPAVVKEAVIDTVDQWIGAIPRGDAAGGGDSFGLTYTQYSRGSVMPGAVSARAAKLLAPYRPVRVG